MEEKYNPICEEALEHGITFCLKYKKEGKTLDDLIQHLEIQLIAVKAEKFRKNEEAIQKLVDQ